jgi:hypothetical protein
MSFWGDDHSEAFYVEPFEAEDTVDTSYREADDEDDAKLDNMVRSRNDEEEESEGMTLDEKKLDEMEKRLDQVVSPKKEVSDTEEESEDMEDKNQEKKSDHKILTKPTAEDSSGPPTKKKEEVESYDVSDEEFAKDIGAILKGQKVYDEKKKKAVGRAEVEEPTSLLPQKTESSPKASVPKDDMLDPDKNEHKIFEKIAQSMQYANSYDLGAMALEEKFEKMEEEIEKEEVNKVLQNKSTDSDEDFQDVNVIEEEEPLTRKEAEEEQMGIVGEKFNHQAPLDNNNGGRLIKADQLQKGDLVLASSSGGVFNVMDSFPSSDSVAGIYIGSDKLLTKGDGDALEEKAVEQSLTGKGVMAVLRHQNMTTERGTAICDALTKLRIGPQKHQPENWVKISSPSVSIHSDVCDAVNGNEKGKCESYAGKIYLGTFNNDSFLCSESIIDAFENNQMSFVSMLTKNNNGSLKYFGHLKNKP